MEKPNLGKLTIQCGKCDKKKEQQIVAQYTDTVIYEDEDEGFYSEALYKVRISLCPSCEAINLSFEDEDGEIVRLYPESPKELEGLPEKIAKAYRAARAVKIVDANAFAVLLGRVLELVCLDRGAQGDSLYI
jgi:hypothetical protein